MIRPRVLLADDHPALVEATTALLKPLFDVVGTAADGATLVSEAIRLCPDVIVADITMPVLSGIDAAHRLRELALSAKIVFLTIHSDGQFRRSMHGRRRIGICCQNSHEDPLDSSNTSGSYRSVLHFSICFQCFQVMLAVLQSATARSLSKNRRHEEKPTERSLLSHRFSLDLDERRSCEQIPHLHAAASAGERLIRAQRGLRSGVNSSKLELL